MWSRTALVVRALVVATVGVALLLLGLGHATAAEEHESDGNDTVQTDSDDGGRSVRATERISIPYGFDATLPLTDDGGSVVASGLGACTDGQSITISFTVTQSSTGATATGVWNGDCTGDVQTWTGEGATATPSPNLAGGTATACAFAETSDEEGVTDAQEWCDPVIVGEAVLMPVIQKP